MKAGYVASGEFAVDKAVKCGKARLVIIAGDASANTKKKFTDMCAYYKVPSVVLKDKETLGQIIGRALAAAIQKSISSENNSK